LHVRKRARAATAAAVAAIAIGASAIVRGTRKHDFANDAVLIAGGSRGLGFALAQEFARRGARVAISGRDPATLASACDRLTASGAEVLPIECDVRDRSQVESATRVAERRLGRLDVLVYNAGTIAVGPMDVMTDDDYRDALLTHFWGAHWSVDAALPVLRRSRGRIVLIASIGGKIGVPHLLPYSVSKFALVGYGEGLRAELARAGVTVTTVCPGLMRTGSPRNAYFKGQHRKEYAWFALSDTNPLTSIAATAAARQIVEACARGTAEIVLSPLGKLGAAFHALFPGATATLMGLVAQSLPGSGGIDERKVRGAESESRLTQSPLTALGRKAEREFNQIRAPEPALLERDGDRELNRD
jgi:NAD(P)-dependent dehydrogenase (short-subunit alcohol dehydrogenase family)